MSMRSAIRGLAAVALLVSSSGAMAQFNHGDIMANNYWFRQVTESSNTPGGDAAIANAGQMFGAPSVTNDSILFSCPNFFAEASPVNSSAQDNTDGKLRFIIEAKQGAVVSAFSFAERGDYQLTGLGYLNALVSVACDVQVRVLELTSGPVAPIPGVFSLSFSNSGNWTAPPNANGPWTGTGGINIDALVLGAGITSGLATKVEVTLDNKLYAAMEAPQGLGTARIVKKQGEGVVINVIPAPGAAALLGLAGLVVGRRRR